MPRVTVPDFNFAAFYYQEILDALIRYKRQNVPEHTDESSYDPLMQFLKMEALVGHLNNTLLDLVANESTLPTAKLPETVRNMLRLIGYEMRPASPSSVDVVLELSRVFSSSFEILPEKSQVATEQETDSNSRYFENLESLTLQRTDQFGSVLAEESTVFTDKTSLANGGGDWTPWASAIVGDKIYFGHDSIMWNQFDFTFSVFSSGISGVWEYYDGSWAKENPSLVETYGAGQLKFYLNSYLGDESREGTTIRVQLNSTTAYEDVVSDWDGTDNYILTTGYLGQTTPSLVEADYTIGSDWEILTVDDETSVLQADGSVSWVLPQSVTQNWIETEVEGFAGFFIRFRVTAVSTPTSPTFSASTLDGDKQYALGVFTQGKNQIDAQLGSSDGTANQSFEVSQKYFISSSMIVSVDDEVWTEVVNFLSSRPTDKHYRVILGEDDTAIVIFGDGVTGKVPPIGVNNIQAEYRWGANEDGNVGANAISLDKSGLTYVSRLWNPRPATGWAIAQGASSDGLEEAKIEGPASLRIKEVAIGGQDVEDMTLSYVDTNGSSPFSRAKAFEGASGPKTVEVVVVASGGSQATAAQIEALQEYFNGDNFSHPILPKRIVANQQVVAINFTPKTIDIEATIYGTDIVEESVRNALLAVFQPEAVKEDGNWEWEFGDDVPLSRIIHEIFSSGEEITKVEVSVPSADVALSQRELPKLGTLTLTIIE
jgi:hypothetical protein